MEKAPWRDFKRCQQQEDPVKRILFGTLALALTLTASPAVAQLAPYNEAGLTMGVVFQFSADVFQACP